MVQRIVLLDDLSNEPEAQTHTIALDGETREIDLTDDNYQRLLKAVEKFWSVAHKAGKAGPTAGRKPKTVRFTRPTQPVTPPTDSNGNGNGSNGADKPVVDKQDNEAIRAWARNQGIQIADHGRIKEQVVQMYRQAAESPAAAPAKLAGTPAPKKAIKAATKAAAPSADEVREVVKQVGDNPEAVVDHFSVTPTVARRLIRTASQELAAAS